MSDPKSADKELSELLELGDRIVGMATKAGITVAECMLRSGAELSARVRLGKPELVEEAAHRSAGLRVMKGRQVATTSTSDLTEGGINRFVADAIELTELIERRYQVKKVVLMGHSWGTVIGLKAALKRPDLFHVYVGVGQVINARDNERESFAYALAESRKHDNSVGLAELESSF